MTLSETSTHSKAVIFDADDTLWELQPIYDQVKAEFADKLSQLSLGEKSRIILELDRIYMDAISKLGFSDSRFPDALLDTYKSLVRDKQAQIDEDLIQKLYSLGMNVLTKLPKVSDKTVSTLEYLKKRFMLLLYTIGDTNAQTKRISELGLDKFFDRKIYVVSNKSSDELKKILTENRLEVENTWMVGNSLKLDINPALSIGMKCIWISKFSWAYDQVEQYSGTVFRVENIEDVISILESN